MTFDMAEPISEETEAARDAWIRRLWEHLCRQGFNLSLEEVRELHERNFTWTNPS